MLIRFLSTTSTHTYTSPLRLINSLIHASSFITHPPKPKWNCTITTSLQHHHHPLITLLSTSSSISHLTQIQAQSITTGLITHPFISSRLILSFSQALNPTYAERILYNVPHPNTHSFNFIIRAYPESKRVLKSISLYVAMMRHGVFPDGYTFPVLFRVCVKLGLKRVGKGIIGHVIEMGFAGDVYVGNGMVSFAAACCGETDARKVFDEMGVRDLVSWNTLINGYVHRGLGREALGVYGEMMGEGVRADEVTMIGAVAAAGLVGNLGRGREFHRFVEDEGLELTVALCNALMDMYVKCGDVKEAEALFENMKRRTLVSWTTMVIGYAKVGALDEARKLFDAIPEKDVVPWNAMLGAYVQAKRCKEALALFHEMQHGDVLPDEVTMVLCLSVCSQLGAVDVGVWIHRYIEANKLELNVALGTALVDMYAKCGNINKALQVFEEIPRKNSLTWTAIIGGLALHGKAYEALLYFSKMIDLGLDPDEVTFIGVLSACCHGGMVDEGRKYFAQMTTKYNLNPRLKHYSCMVDLLGRAGLLHEAEKLINAMPMEADAVVWSALFFSCRTHGNISIGEKAAWKLIELDPSDSGTYVLLSTMYWEARMWDEAREVRKMMRENGVEKIPGCSSIEIDGGVSEFIIRDKSHPLAEKIYGCLIRLTEHLGYLERVFPAGGGSTGLGSLMNEVD